MGGTGLGLVRAGRSSARIRAAALGAHVDRRGDAYLAFPPGREPEALRAAPVPLEIVCRTPVLVLARVHLAGPRPAAPSGD